MFLPAKIRLRALHCLGERVSVDGERGLAGAMFVSGIVANSLDEAHIEARHGELPWLNVAPDRRSGRRDGEADDEEHRTKRFNHAETQAVVGGKPCGEWSRQ